MKATTLDVHGIFPRHLGTITRKSPAALADRAFGVMASIGIAGKHRAALTIDPRGVVRLEGVDDAVGEQIVATITMGSDPDWLAEQIAHERNCRRVQL